MSEKLSLCGNVWQIKSANERIVDLIAQRFDLPQIIARLLSLRNIMPDEVENFLNPKIQNLMPDPCLLKDMDKVAKRLATAIKNHEKIGIIGDYDVDGATSSALLGLFFEYFGLKTMTHIPERDEGYGPSQKAFDEFASNNIKLVITTDCGTTAFDILESAKQQDFEIIIIDHHEAEAKLPNVYAVVNPKRLDENNLNVSFNYMSAVGVVFMTITAINRELKNSGFYNNNINSPNLLQWLDLVALGTVCDVVPLLGLNRAFVHQGLKVIANRTNIGIKTLFDKSGITNYPTSYSLGFALGPRINACGRVGEAFLGNRLLTAKSQKEADEIVDKMNNFNTERKEIENVVLLQAMEMLESKPQQYPFSFVYSENWHQGVIGIVAGRLKEKYNLPAFVMSIEPDEVKGSARSVQGINVGAIIIAAKEKGLITKGGGHIMAAGFSLEKDKIPAFYQFVGETIQKQITENYIEPTVEIDSSVEIGGINFDLAQKISLLEPFGAGNEEPLFLIKNVMVTFPTIIGSGHIKCTLKSDNGNTIKAIAFRITDTELGKKLLSANNNYFDFVGNIHVDCWQNKNLVQFIIKDAREI